MYAIFDKIKSLTGKSPNSPQFAKTAEEMRLNGQPQKAILFCQEGLKLRPGYATGYYVLARCYIDENKNSNAKDALVEALRFGPHHIAVLTELAALYHNEGNLNQALNYYRQTLALDPLNRRVRNLVETLSEKTGITVITSEAVEFSEDPIIPPPGTIKSDDRHLSQDSSAPTEAVESEESEPEATEPIADIEPEIYDAEPVGLATRPLESVSSPVVFATGLWIAEIFQDSLPASELSPEAAGHGILTEDFTTHIFENMLAFNTAETDQMASPWDTEEDPASQVEVLLPDMDDVALTEGHVTAEFSLDTTEEMAPDIEFEEAEPAIELWPEEVDQNTSFFVAPTPEDIESRLSDAEVILEEPDSGVLHEDEAVTPDAHVSDAEEMHPEEDTNLPDDHELPFEAESPIMEPSQPTEDYVSDKGKGISIIPQGFWEKSYAKPDFEEEAHDPEEEVAHEATEPPPVADLVEIVQETDDLGQKDLVDSESYKEPEQIIGETPIVPQTEEESDVSPDDASYALEADEEKIADEGQTPISIAPQTEEESDVSPDDASYALEADEVPKTPMPIAPADYLDQFFSGKQRYAQTDQESADSLRLGKSTSEVPHDLDTQKDEITSDVSASEALGTGISSDTVVAPSYPDLTHFEAIDVSEEEQQAPYDEEQHDGEVRNNPKADAIPTATLAELYVRQKLTDRAISVYLAMIEHDPTNPDIHKRLAELFVLKAEQDGP